MCPVIDIIGDGSIATKVLQMIQRSAVALPKEIASLFSSSFMTGFLASIGIVSISDANRGLAKK